MTRSGSTGFQVPPPSFRSEPTMIPSATSRNDATLPALAPVFASTGARSPTACLASRTAAGSGAAPAIGPDTRIASARLDTAAERASWPTERLPMVDANSGVTFMNTATCWAPRARR